MFQKFRQINTVYFQKKQFHLARLEQQLQDNLHQDLEVQAMITNLTNHIKTITEMIPMLAKKILTIMTIRVTTMKTTLKKMTRKTKTRSEDQ